MSGQRPPHRPSHPPNNDELPCPYNSRTCEQPPPSYNSPNPNYRQSATRYPYPDEDDSDEYEPVRPLNYSKSTREPRPRAPYSSETSSSPQPPHNLPRSPPRTRYNGLPSRPDFNRPPRARPPSPTVSEASSQYSTISTQDLDLNRSSSNFNPTFSASSSSSSSSSYQTSLLDSSSKPDFSFQDPFRFASSDDPKNRGQLEPIDLCAYNHPAAHGWGLN